MDGCGLAPADGENAVAAAKTPFLDNLYEKYPHTTLGASGEDVGLPDGQMGNSEVGHLNIGAGRIVFQELSRINNAIKDGSIAKNEVFVKAMDDVKADGKTLHLMGLMSPGGVHSHMNHVEALVKMAAQHGVKTVRVHAFMDGRDVDPQSGAGYMSEFCAFLAKISEETGCDARVATVSGRYWAMDRDNRWERIQRAYDVMVNASDADTDPVAGIKAYYEKDPRGDEFVEPFAAHNEGIHEGDAAIFFNFRPDRARQMTRVFTDKEFDGFERDAGMFVIVGIGLLCAFMPILLMYLTTGGVEKRLRAYRMLNIGGYNIGCFSLPLVQAFFGNTGVVAACMFDTGNAIMMTGGAYAMTSTLLKTGGEQRESVGDILMKFVKSLPFDAYMLMILLAALDVKLPSAVFTLTRPAGQANAFIAMMMIGMMFEPAGDKALLRETARELLGRYLFAAVSAALVFFCTPFELVVRQTLCIVCFAPLSSLAPIYTDRCHSDTALASFTNSVSIAVSLVIMLALGLGFVL